MISTTWFWLYWLDDEVLQRLELGDIGRVHVAGHVERVQHPLQKLAAIAGGVRDQPDHGGLVEDSSGVAAAASSCRRPTSPVITVIGRAGHHPVFEDGEGALVRRRPVQEIGSGRSVKGRSVRPKCCAK
jgi:hypothetical protein